MACVKKRPFVGEHAETSTNFLKNLGFVNIDDVSEYSVWKNGDIVLNFTQDDWIVDHNKLMRQIWGVAKMQGRLEGIKMSQDAMKNKVDGFLKSLFDYV